MIGMSLTEADVTSCAKDGDTYNIVIKDCANVKKDGSNGLSRVTNDFITHEEVVDGIAGFTSAIKVNSTTVNYKNIKVTVKVEGGKITNIKYSYAFDAIFILFSASFPKRVSKFFSVL